MPIERKDSEQSTGRTQAAEQIEGSGLAEQKPFVLSVRFTGEDRRILSEHFGKKGLSLSTGVRFVVREYMEKNDLI